MGTAEGWSYEDDQDKPIESAKGGPDQPAESTEDDEAATVTELHQPVETRTRGEAYAQTRQSVESGWDPRRSFEAPQEELAKFKTARAGLREISVEEADGYIKEHRAERPWLGVAEQASPDARRIFAALDQGCGHGHIRHEGWTTEEANMRRVALLEDPAQLDAEKRLQGVDGLKPNDKPHYCGVLATRITDPDAFATAFARGTEHPEVQAALNAPHQPKWTPDFVSVQIADLLGDDGHKLCTGWQLEPVAGTGNAAIASRNAWRTEMAKEGQTDLQTPRARPVATFEGGSIVFVLGHNEAKDGYEIITFYARPRNDEYPKLQAISH
jgi:hypothetical protein